MADKKLSSFDKKVNIFAAVFLLVIFSCVLILLNTGKIDFTISDNKLEINSSYYSGYSVLFDDIEAVEYIEKDHKGSREFGFGSSKLSLGTFENDAFGKYTRYSYTKCKSSIIITETDGDILVISKASDIETFDFYIELQNLIN